jgi:hypothetical protein
VRISGHEGSRDDLRQPFEMAEDSNAQLNSYIDDGELFVAQRAQEGVVGHLQLISRDSAAGEIKNLAVTPKCPGTMSSRQSGHLRSGGITERRRTRQGKSFSSVSGRSAGARTT